jgi:hypothetical protein
MKTVFVALPTRFNLQEHVGGIRREGFMHIGVPYTHPQIYGAFGSGVSFSVFSFLCF